MRRNLLFVVSLAGCGGGTPTFVDAAIDGTAADAADVDSSPIDASIIDSSPVDAATDAAVIDSSPVDAATDAAVIDSAPTDAATDALEIDAITDATPILIDANPDVDAPTDAPTPIDATVDAVRQEQYYWADWTSGTPGAPSVAAGTFSPPSGTIDVTYTGDIRFAKTDGSGPDYWLPDGPYINAVTANGPSPNTDIIAMEGGDVQTIQFDPPVTGLVMGIVSLGQPGSQVKYAFDTEIALLSSGQGYFGSGVLIVDVSQVTGEEGHGTIMFAGTVSTLTWTVTGSEFWHGWTFGIPNQQ